MPRFTVLLHDPGPGLTRMPSDSEYGDAPEGKHWDWLFEPSGTTADSLLKTWASRPLVAPGTCVDLTKEPVGCEAIRLPDHRPIYLDFEGDIGRERGTVKQVTTGIYELIATDSNSFQTHVWEASSRILPRGVPTQLSFHRDRGDKAIERWLLSLRAVTS